MKIDRKIQIAEPDPRWGGADDTQLHIVLVEPQIPPNTGNIARLCAAAGAHLHLVKPLGFALENKHLRRAGLDYWPEVWVTVHESFDAIEATFPPERLHLFSTHGTKSYSAMTYAPGAVLVFGCESKGLDPAVRARHADRMCRIPMKAKAVRSLNLSNSVAIALYEALRQLDFPGVLD